jgi:hypothetical protein
MGGSLLAYIGKSVNKTIVNSGTVMTWVWVTMYAPCSVAQVLIQIIKDMFRPEHCSRQPKPAVSESAIVGKADQQGPHLQCIPRG